MRLGRAVFGLLGIALLAAGSAAAIQFTPPSTARLHTLGSSQPGAEWDTEGVGVGGQLSYDSGTGTLSMTAVLDTLNYFDTADLSCPTDIGSNCSLNFGVDAGTTQDLDITLSASFDSLVVTPLGGTFVNVQANFGGTGGVDLTVTDPADSDAEVFRASWVAGTFQGTPTVGLSASVVYDTAAGTTFGLVNASGFLEIDQTSLYAGLFLPDYFGLTFAALDNFNDGSGGDLAAVLAASITTGTLVDFTAEGNGQVLRTATGDFVPEAGSLLTLGTGVLLLGRFLRRRRDS